jgi:hypothetical protein
MTATPCDCKSCDQDPAMQYWEAEFIGSRVPWDEVVIDIDPRKGATHRTICAWYDEKTGNNLPVTRQVYSGRLDGGVHLFWKRPIDPDTGEVIPLTEVRMQKVLGDGFDLKTNLGYTILPPSIHPDTGASYEWRDDGLDSPVLELPRH